MRIAVISDIHGNLIALEAVLADIKERGADLAVNLGDLCTGPLWPRETLELLDTLAIPTVRGNHDRALSTRPGYRVGQFTFEALSPAQRSRLVDLPPTLRLDGGILCCHGTPQSDQVYLLEDKLDGRLAMSTRAAIAERLGGTEAPVVLCGHSHHANVVYGPGDCLIVNPGTVGCPLFGDSPDATKTEARSPHARYAIMTRRRTRWSVDLIALEYDWDRAAAQATANGRADIARIFSAGSFY